MVMYTFQRERKSLKKWKITLTNSLRKCIHKKKQKKIFQDVFLLTSKAVKILLIIRKEKSLSSVRIVTRALSDVKIGKKYFIHVAEQAQKRHI